MARTTKAYIEAIIELDAEVIPNDAAMEPFILMANELVTECCTGDNGPASAYTDDRLELIERWLAAHCYTLRDPRYTNEKAGSVGASYQSKVDLGFQSKVDLGFDTSHYGQMAMRMDTNGGLAALNTQTKKGASKVGGSWLGTPASEVSSRT